jgi:aryl-alcohol dehydrogenase-like predicted oxidoreductase
MRTVQLGNTGLTSSVLGFGCGAVMGRVGRRGSLRALGAAWDAGITLYDTARSYGYGESETLLGEFLATRRDQAVISTKFGILAAPQRLWKRVAKPVARAVLTVAPGVRGVLRRRTAGEFAPNLFTVSVLEQSLDESLRKLRTDYVDLLFMHAAPASALEQEDLLAALEKLVEAGKVRVAGISAEPEVVEAALQQQARGLGAVQFPCNVFDLRARTEGAAPVQSEWAAIANHPFGGANRVQESRAVLKRVAASPGTSAQVRGKLGDVDDAVLADVVLNVILQSGKAQAVIPAMMKPAHIEANVRAVSASRWSREEIDWLHAAIVGRGEAE